MKQETSVAWQSLAKTPRRSYLGKYRRLTPSQNRWVRSLLNHWGATFGGSGTEHLSGGGSGMWSMIITGWSGDDQERITDVLIRLREIGYTGDQLISQAKAILWPKRTLSDMMRNAIDMDEAEFMEAIILKSFSEESLVYTIGKNYYMWRQPIADTARWMRYHHAPSLTEKQCIDRVRWCIEFFNSAVFFTLRAELSIENEEKSQKDLQISFQAA